MKSIAVISQSSWKEFNFENSGPWRNFEEVFLFSNFNFVEAGSRPDIIINLNHKYFSNYLHFFSTIRKNRILILFEPKVNSPLNFNLLIRKLYGQVYVPSKYWSMDSPCELFSWPQSDPSVIESSFFQKRRENRAVLIAADRYSFASGEMYSLRRGIALSEKIDLDVFGNGWNTPLILKILKSLKSLMKHLASGNFDLRFPKYLTKRIDSSRYRGYSQNKFETLSRYKYSIVIENSLDYLSEKLMDAIIAGTIPIYVGPRLSEMNLPSGLAFEAEPSILGIEKALSAISQNELLQQKILETGQTFLKSPDYDEIVNVKSLKTLALTILRKLNQIGES